MSDRQKLFYALLASALIHVAIAICLILAAWIGWHPGDVEKAPAPQPPTQLTVTIMPSRPSPPTVPAAPKQPPASLLRPVLDSDGLAHSSKAPAHADFQSDANMTAGSQLPANGNLPLPTQEGPRRKFLDFADQAASSGKGESRPQPPPARQSAQAARPAPSMPEQTPAAITQVQPTPTPVPAPSAGPDTLALGRPTPTPLPTPVAELARLTAPPSLRGHADIAPMTRSPSPLQPAPPSLPAEAATQRETEKTHIDGGIATAGQPGVDAIETPFGRYHRKLSNLIGSRWKLYLQEHPKDVGDVTILVKLDTSGKVTNTRVIANHSVDDLAELSTRAILESDLPPVPDDLAPMLRDGKLEISFNFNVYDASNDSPGR